MNENVSDKLRIQIFQIISASSSNAASNSTQLYPIGKKDIPIYSIVSRESYISLMNKLNQESGLNLNDSIGDLNQFPSSFSHGNNLNAMMSMTNSTTNPNSFKNRANDKSSHRNFIVFRFVHFKIRF